MGAASGKLLRTAGRFFERDELPDELAWAEKLTPLHKRLFTVDLKAALDKAAEDDGALLREVLESWEATASVDADPDLSAALKKAPASRKRYTVWHPAAGRTK